VSVYRLGNLWVSVCLWSKQPVRMSADNHCHATIALLDGVRAVKRAVTCTNPYLGGEENLSKSL